jgi:murein DD-endopeptidase MepM/ murein hydrolase activator NlpD
MSGAAVQAEAIPTVIPFRICSPLGWETLPELAEIVGDPYKPPPPERAEERHHGVDFSHWSRKGHPSIEGEPVQAVLSGIVAASISNRLPYGNMLILETPQDALPAGLIEALGLEPGQSLYLLYAHMQQAPALKVGDAVTCGQELGLVGAVGYNVVNAHLHLETRRGPAGVRFESMAFYTTDATPAEMAAYQRWRTGGEFVHFDPFLLLNAVVP